MNKPQVRTTQPTALTAALLCVASLTACGCSGDETDVIEATISGPSATLEQVGGLEHGLSGSFDVNLHLGPDSSAGAAGVYISGVQVRDPDAGSFHPPLKFAMDPPEPLSISRDTDLRIEVSFVATDNPQDPSRVDEMCQSANGVVAMLRLADPLADAAHDVRSERFSVTGCP